ncbi:MAG: YihY/virulence factor BrkB family protein [Polyangia bacterium]
MMGKPQKRRCRLFEQFGEMARATVFPEGIVSSRRQFVLVFAIRLLFLVGRRLWRDQMPRQAAALAFQTLLSLVPLLAVVLSVASTLELDWLRERMLGYLQAQLLPEAASEVGRYVTDLARGIRPRTLGVIGVATLVAISVTMLFNIEVALNDVFRAARGRRLWLRVTAALVVLIGAPLAFGLSLYFSGKLLVLTGFASAWLPLLLTTAALFLCYWRLPHTPTMIRHSLVAAVVAGVGLELLKYGFALYARHLAVTVSAIYGTLAILPLFMLWIYLAWLLFLFGAELSAALHEVGRHDRFS